MEQMEQYHEIVERLNKGMKFGLFENGMKCYFQDGTQIKYNELWRAIKIQMNLESANKPLSQLCPDTYVGTYSYKYSKHDWKKTSTTASR
jgi:hypothetical protein